LVLHGGSGLSDDDFQNCISHGVQKINIYTDVVSNAMKKNTRNRGRGRLPFNHQGVGRSRVRSSCGKDPRFRRGWQSVE
jgi:hypothetical protein